MIEFDFLYKGLWGLARAQRANGMAEHLSDAAVASYFFGEEHPDLDSQVKSSIEQQLDSIMIGEESIWYDLETAGITIPEMFALFPKERPQNERIATITRAQSGAWRQYEHNDESRSQEGVDGYFFSI